MSNWYKWDSVELFENWHDEIKIKLGIPKQSTNQSGDISSEAIVTDSYTNHYIVNEFDVRAIVESEQAEALTPSENPFPNWWE